jgi:uncharacterized alkaline shock family protein YloU
MARESSGKSEVEPSSEAAQSTASTAVVQRGSGAAPLQSERGATVISTVVVTKVAGIAAREVAGVHTLGGGTSRAIGAMTQRVGIGDERTQGVSVEVGEREAAVDLTVVIDYGESIPQVAQQVRDNVIKRIEGITGLSVTEVNVNVDDLYFPGDEEPEEERRVS